MSTWRNARVLLFLPVLVLAISCGAAAQNENVSHPQITRTALAVQPSPTPLPTMVQSQLAASPLELVLPEAVPQPIPAGWTCIGPVEVSKRVYRQVVYLERLGVVVPLNGSHTCLRGDWREVFCYLAELLGMFECIEPTSFPPR